MIDISFNNNIEPIDISLQNGGDLDLNFNTGVAVQGSIVIPNPESEPTDDLETVRINADTYRIKDPQLQDWARGETKPSYNYNEVGAVGQDETLPYDEIDRLVNAVFGI